jgi:hypothetical protein
VILLGFLLWQGVVYFKHRGLVGVTVAVLPDDSSLFIDGQKTKPGKVYLTHGIHNLIATRPDFGDDNKTLDTAYIQKKETVYMLPVATTLAAKDWLVLHPDIQKRREAAGGSEAERIRQELLKKYPFLDRLTYENLHFKIDYSVDDKQKINIRITTLAIINGPADYPSYVAYSKNYQQEAAVYLKKNGVDISKYNVTYIPDLK